MLVAKASQKVNALSATKPRKYFSLSLSTESITLLEEVCGNNMTGEQRAALVPLLNVIQLGCFLLLFPLLAALPG